MGKLIKFFISLILLIISLFIENEILYLVIILSSYFICAYPVIIKAIKNIFNGKLLDENFLITLATIVAICLSEYTEAVAVILFYTLGISFEHFALDKSRKSIKELMDIRPDYANLVVDDIQKIDCEDVKINDIIRVFPGEKIPLDGIVIKGSASLDTSSITGESNLSDVLVNDEVISGCININGIIDIKVSKVFSESTVSKILELVENATNSKSKQEQFIKKFAKVYTPVVVILCLFISLVVPLLFKQDFSTWIYRGLNMLVVSCPCALVISIPMSFFGGIATASRVGVLIKGSNYFETISKVDTIVLDKTGTITKGKFIIKEIIPNDISKEELIKYAVINEYNSLHPIALVIKSINDLTIDENLLNDYKEEIGFGISLNYNNDFLVCGNSKIMDKYNIKYNYSEGIVVYFALNNKFIGTIILEDEIKDNSLEIISNVRSNGVKNIVMLSGDNEYSCKKVSEKINLDKYYSNLLPHEKVEILKKYLNGKCCFVGDGINDAPSLRIADIGISMGGVGSNAAIEASDVVIMNDDLNKINDIIKISKRTLRICKQNIVFALSIKVVILILAVFGLSNLWIAILGDVGVSIIAILNALRILIKKK
ncbi:MAG: heavy metal translocating P-type ATPase [bacterium]